MSFAWLTLAGLGVLLLMVKSAASEMLQEEAETRLARLPNSLIRLAAMRLPEEVRDDNAAEWRGELACVLSDTDGLPLTRLLRGTWYAMGLFWAAGNLARELTQGEETASTEAPAGDLLSDLTVAHAGSVGYRGPTACAVAGITYRQLDYWERTGLVEPSICAPQGSGSQRLYGFRDIIILKVVKLLLDTGISMHQIRAAALHLRDHGTEHFARVTFMSDGKNLYECVSPDEVVDLLQSGQGVFGVSLSRIWQQIVRELREFPAVDITSGLIHPTSSDDAPEGHDFPS